MNPELMLQTLMPSTDFVSWMSTDFLTLITSVLRIPVLILLYGLTLWLIVEVGMLTFEWLTRTGRLSKKRPKDLEEGLQEAVNLMVQDIENPNAREGKTIKEHKEAIAMLKNCTSHKFVHIFLNELSTLKNDELFAVRLQKLLQTCDEEMTKRLEKTRTAVRIGPILGLMGTLIPMGPALLALTQGDINTLATSLIFAFGTTVLGLLVGGVAYVITTVRQHWYDKDMNDMRYICEMLFGGE
ncbi:Biopolymer transport protein ExbB/TolQ [Candidatus Methanophagaceae archaeon]|nr:Biopolymer transport protein ExbB/TolQ [Methanophagales archaeon]